MIYRRLALKNIRSFVSGEISFFEGFQCIIGGVGAGKTTILLATDFALFGRPLFGPIRGFDYLLRGGAQSGRVELEFEHHERTYRVVRGLRRAGKRVVEDASMLELYEDGKLIARGKERAVEEEILGAVGLNHRLFRETLWIRQERLKEIIDLTPSRRRERVDEILGLVDLEIAWERMRDYERLYEDDIKGILEKDPYIPLIDQLRKQYDDLTERLVRVERDAQRLGREAERLMRRIEACDRSLNELARLEERLREWERRRYEVQVNLTHCERVLEEAAERVEISKNGLEERMRELEELDRASRELWEGVRELGVSPDLGTEGISNFLRSLEEERRRVESGRDVEVELIKEARRKLEGISKHDRCPTCLRPITPDYRQRLLADLAGKISAGERKVESYGEAAQRLTELIEKVRFVHNSLESYRARRGALENKLALAQEALDVEERRYSDYESRVKALREELAAVEGERPEFDASLVDKIRAERDSLSGQLARVEGELGHLRALKGDLGDQVEKVKARLDRAERDRLLVQRKERILKYIREFRELYRRAQPVLRREYVQWLEHIIQDVLSDIRREAEPLTVKLDEESYTPIVSIGKGEPLILLSGGERTQLALAYRVALSQLVMDTKGRELDVLLIDEPTASLGREDTSIIKLADAISRFKGIRQIIAVTHSEDFADQADHVIEITKTHAGSQVRVVK